MLNFQGHFIGFVAPFIYFLMAVSQIPFNKLTHAKGRNCVFSVILQVTAVIALLLFCATVFQSHSPSANGHHLFSFGRPSKIRTQTKGFGDHCATVDTKDLCGPRGRT